MIEFGVPFPAGILNIREPNHCKVLDPLFSINTVLVTPPQIKTQVPDDNF
jgi:hypothetical protein